MESMDEDRVLGHEEAMLWLPAHVFEEACESKEYFSPQSHQQLNRVKTFNTSLPTETVHQHSFTKSSSKLNHHRRRYPLYRTSAGGPGMQAIFLDSGQRSCGTGFFLPRRAADNIQTTNKPVNRAACSSVLLPTRVVQALNLNVHALGSKSVPQPDRKHNARDGRCYSVSNTNNNDVIDSVSRQSQCSVFSQQARSTSQEIYLPKEWSY